MYSEIQPYRWRSNDGKWLFITDSRGLTDMCSASDSYSKILAMLTDSQRKLLKGI